MSAARSYATFDRAVRGPLTVVLPDVEVVLSEGDISVEEPLRKAESVIEAGSRVKHMLVEWRGAPGDPQR